MNCLLFESLAFVMLSAPCTPPPNDDCANAIAIVGEGAFALNNLAATEVPDSNECIDMGNQDVFFRSDVWYCWTSEDLGPVTIDTCGSTVADTKIAVYEGCDCPADTFLACDDDACGFQSILEFHATPGQEYLVRIGASPGFATGSDTFHIARRSYDQPSWYTCDPAIDPATFTLICHSRSHWDALNSTRGQLQAIDGFVPEQSGAITRSCWAGTYLNNGEECIRHTEDSFEVTYFADDCGAPGEVIAGPFSQANGTLDVTGPAMTTREFPNGAQEFEYGADHANVSVVAGQTYWVAITNSPEGDCAWYWETAAPIGGYSLQLDFATETSIVAKTDMAFCFNVHHETDGLCISTPPINDDCSMALPLLAGTTSFQTVYADTDGPFHYYNRCELPLGDFDIHKDIWFSLDGPCAGTIALSTCESDFDTRIAVYDSATCLISDSADPFWCGEDGCGEHGLNSIVFAPVSEERSYLVRLGGYNGDWGAGELVFHYVPSDRGSLLEFAALSNCFQHTVNPDPSSAPACCIALDFNGDGVVDLTDVTHLVAGGTGPK